MRRHTALALAAGVVTTVVLGMACARDSAAQTARFSGPLIPDDTTAVATLLASVRGAKPLLCEMATRAVDQRGWWSNWGPLGDDPLETDSASAALIRWIQTRHNDPALVPRLRNAMHDDDACVRRVGGSLLSRVQHQSAVAALMDGLGDTRAEVREVAAFGLGMAEYHGAVDDLIARLKDPSPRVRRASAWALGSIEPRKAVPPLMDVLTHDSDARVRQTAAWAIGNIH